MQALVGKRPKREVLLAQGAQNQQFLAHCSTKQALVKAHYSEVSHDDIFWVYIARSLMENMAKV